MDNKRYIRSNCNQNWITVIGKENTGWDTYGTHAASRFSRAGHCTGAGLELLPDDRCEQSKVQCVMVHQDIMSQLAQLIGTIRNSNYTKSTLCTAQHSNHFLMIGVRCPRCKQASKEGQTWDRPAADTSFKLLLHPLHPHGVNGRLFWGRVVESRRSKVKRFDLGTVFI